MALERELDRRLPFITLRGTRSERTRLPSEYVAVQFINK
jgi:hypothetical protein